MDCLKEIAVREGAPCAQPRISNLHQAFLNNIKKWGRLYEAALLPAYLLNSDKLLDEWNSGNWRYSLKLGHQMLSKRRLSLWPASISGKSEVRKILAQRKSEHHSQCK
jgi:hypothetical protein